MPQEQKGPAAASLQTSPRTTDSQRFIITLINNMTLFGKLRPLRSRQAAPWLDEPCISGYRQLPQFAYKDAICCASIGSMALRQISFHGVADYRGIENVAARNRLS